jgi:hypothetical protein
MVMATRLSVLFTKRFWFDAAERAAKSFAQGALAALSQDVAGADLFAANVRTVIAAGLLMAVLSVLTSVASAPVPGISPASMLPAGVD